MRKDMPEHLPASIATALLASLLLTAAPAAFAGETTIFSDDFESTECSN